MKRFLTLLMTVVAVAAMGWSQDLELAPFKGNARGAVSYTFDDGLVEHYTMVLPRLDSLDIKATFWIIADNIDTRKPMRDHLPMTWAQVQDVAAHGHELGSHGYRHIALNEITPPEIDREIEQNDSAIYVHTGIHPVSFCFPGNGRPDWVIKQVLAHRGITGARTWEQGMGGGATAGWMDSWAAEAMERGEWRVAMIHGITHGWDAFDHPEELWRHLEHVAKMRDEGKLWIATFEEVTAYQKGLSETATYKLPRKPRRVIQNGHRLKAYQSWDGTWCVDARRDAKIKVKY